MFQGCSRNIGDISKSGSTKGGNDTAASGPDIVRRAHKVIETLSRDGAELLQVVFRIQLLFLDRILADDVLSKNKTAARHSAAGRSRRIAFWVDQSVAVIVDSG